MEADLFLADAADATNGKASVIGLGWTTISSPLPQYALVAFLRVPKRRAGRRLELAFRLHEGEGAAVRDAAGEHVVVEGWLQTELKLNVAGLSHELPVVVTIPAGMDLTPGVYEWRLLVDQHQRARRRFAVLGDSSPKATSPTHA